jgi:hypothetical protein
MAGRVVPLCGRDDDGDELVDGDVAASEKDPDPKNAKRSTKKTTTAKKSKATKDVAKTTEKSKPETETSASHGGAKVTAKSPGKSGAKSETKDAKLDDKAERTPRADFRRVRTTEEQ